MRKQQGAALLMAVLIVLLAVGVPLLLKVLAVSAAKVDQGGNTAQRLIAVDNALAAYAATYRRLPCPADGGIPSSGVGAGIEARDGNGDCTSQTTGVAPWITLGLSEASITDGWGGRLTYRVPTGGQGFSRNGALDATYCDPMGSNPALMPATASTAVSCTNACAPLPPTGVPAPPNPTCNAFSLFLANRGFVVRNGAGVAVRDPAAATGAVYVLISHGSEGGGAFNSAGALPASAIAPGSNGEIRNLNNQALPGMGFFSDTDLRTGSNAGTAHFDDALSYPTISEFLGRTALGARSH